MPVDVLGDPRLLRPEGIGLVSQLAREFLGMDLRVLPGAHHDP
jgi:hypothetical protein